MYSYRITKYNPLYRDSCGNYKRNDWTSYSDIGKKFSETRLTEQHYKVIEDHYIQAIALLMDYTAVDVLEVRNMENCNACRCDVSGKLIKDNDLLNRDDVAILARMILREELWCKLESAELSIHFGYDFYMYAVLQKPISTTLLSLYPTLFVEEHRSPYL